MFRDAIALMVAQACRSARNHGFHCCEMLNSTPREWYCNKKYHKIVEGCSVFYFS